MHRAQDPRGADGEDGMTLTRRRFLLVAAALAGSAAAASPGRSRTWLWRGSAMGGEATLRLEGEDAAAQDALAAAEAEIRRLDAVFSLHDPGSALARLNANGALAAPPLDLVEALTRAGRWRALSDGAFDPRVQPLWRALAEGRDPRPARAALARAYAADVAVAPDRLDLATGVALTLNGLAPGLITDRVTALLRARGFATLTVDAGEMRLAGPRRTVALPELGVEARLAEAAVAVSLPRALVLPDGSPHILRPGGAPPVWSAVAAIARDAATADALSTAVAAAPAEAAGPLAAGAADAAVLARAPDGRLRRFGDAALLRELRA
jgi:thiamine biosynthesis lipoprotein